MYYARHNKDKNNCILLFEGLEGLTFIVFDTETTGLKPEKDYIVEIGAKKYQIRDHKAVLIDTLSVYIKPPFEMDEKVVAIHHITNEFLKDKPLEKEIFAQVYDFFGPKPILVGYNVGFDIRMMESMFLRNNTLFQSRVVLDVREMGYDIMMDDKDVTDHRLGTLVSLLGLDNGLEFHSAIDDTEATFRLLLYFYQKYKEMPVQSDYQDLYINAIYYWKGRRKEQAGIYLNTNLGIIYFSTFKKAWCSSVVDLQTINVDNMENYVLSRLGVTYDFFNKITEKRFQDIKMECRKKGIYL